MGSKLWVRFTMLIELNGKPKSDVIVKIGHGYVLVSYDRKGCLRLIRGAKDGQIPAYKPKSDETVFRVTDFAEGQADYKSSGSHSGLFSMNGHIYWSAIWDDVEPSIYKECSFKDWVDECARALAGEKKEVSST
jgi:hypothetical protein